MCDNFIVRTKGKGAVSAAPSSSAAQCYCGRLIRGSRGGGDATMIIAMGAVRMMKVSVHQVIRMISVRYAIMTAPGAVRMVLWMATAVVLRCAIVRVRCANRQDVVIDVIAVDVVQMPVVQIDGVVAVPDSRMTAAPSMLVVMRLVHVTVPLSHPVLILIFELSCSGPRPHVVLAAPRSGLVVGCVGATGVAASPEVVVSLGKDEDFRACFRASLASRFCFCFCSLARLAAV